MKLKEISFESSGIFSTMVTAVADFELWDAEEATYMDAEYIFNWSGQKPAAPLLENFLEDEVLSETNTIKIAKLIYARYKRNWEEYMKWLEADYDVFDDVEDTTRTITEANLDTPLGWKTTSTGLAADNQTEVNSSVYGYNSSSAVPDGKTESKTSSKMETEQTGNFKREHGLTETFHSKGSSKMRTGSEMLELDERFWSRWNFIENIFKDTDKVLTCPYYE